MVDLAVPCIRLEEDQAKTMKRELWLCRVC
jgi:hypothetical protein